MMVRYRAVEPACLVCRFYGASFAVKVLLEWLTPRYRALRVLCSTLTAPAAPRSCFYEARSVSAKPDRDGVSGASALVPLLTGGTGFAPLALSVFPAG